MGGTVMRVLRSILLLPLLTAGIVAASEAGVTFAADTSGPAINFVTPESEATVSGTVPITILSVDPSGTLKENFG